MIQAYAEFCYNQVGNYVLDYLDYFQDIRPQLSKANLEVSLPEYVSMMFFTSLVLALFIMVVFGSVWALSSGVIGFIYSAAIAMIAAAVSAVVFYLYPQVVIQRRAQKMKNTLPFATMYLSTLAGTGTSVPRLFQVLSSVEEYGEVTREAERISRDIQTFNMDASEALRRAAERSPSREFKELMWGMNHSLSSGGSLREFLRQRADRLMDDYRRRVEQFAEQLSLLVEMYITVVIVGSIIFTSISVVLSTFSQGIDPGTIVAIQVLSVFLGLPIISGMFILLVSGLSPGGIH